MIYEVKETDVGLRLDKMLIEAFPAATFTLIQKLCRKGQIRINGKRVKGNERVEKNQEVKLPNFLSETELKLENRVDFAYQLSKKERHDLENMMLFEDENIVLLNKDYGLPVQAGSGHSKSLDRMLKAYADEAYEPKLVHRIDKTTTGLVLFSKNKPMARELSNFFKTRQVEKNYIAVVQGKVKVRDYEGTIKSEIAQEENEDGYETMAVKKNAQKCETYYKILQSAGIYHLVQIIPKTGRKHQIRVHMASIGLPLVGDLKYEGEKFESNERDLKNKLFLHAYELKVPSYQKIFKAPLPIHFTVIMKLMQWDF
jgi:23S rRNA pseudouridine955/2504/2580 synthase